MRKKVVNRLTNRQKVLILRKAASILERDFKPEITLFRKGMCDAISEATYRMFRRVRVWHPLSYYGIRKTKEAVEYTKDGWSYWYPRDKEHLLIRQKHLLDAAKRIERKDKKKYT